MRRETRPEKPNYLGQSVTLLVSPILASVICYSSPSTSPGFPSSFPSAFPSSLDRSDAELQLGPCR
ncbi:hypothetical protein LY78DRAFT_651788 [Colletotrichum sublineola]|nr:hypothetical protein LY78DRAFT_651788 [Colletotrichum sublineola]